MRLDPRLLVVHVLAFAASLARAPVRLLRTQPIEIALANSTGLAPFFRDLLLFEDGHVHKVELRLVNLVALQGRGVDPNDGCLAGNLVNLVHGVEHVLVEVGIDGRPFTGKLDEHIWLRPQESRNLSSLLLPEKAQEVVVDERVVFLELEAANVLYFIVLTIQLYDNFATKY